MHFSTVFVDFWSDAVIVAVKYFFIFLCSFLIYKKLLRIPICTGKVMLDGVLSAALVVILYGINQYIIGAIFITVAMFCVASGLIYKQSLSVSFVTGIIAAGMANIVFSAATIVGLTITYFFFHFFPLVPKETIMDRGFVFLGLLQLLIATIPFRFSRLKNGMPYLQQGRAGKFGVVVSLLLLLAVTLLSNYPNNEIRTPLYIVVAAEVCLALILWWRAKIIARFRERMGQKQRSDLEAENRRLREENDALRRDGEKLAKIVHTYGKLFRTVGTELKEVNETAVYPSEAEAQRARDLLESIDAMAKEVSIEFFDYRNRDKRFPLTGVSAVDAVISGMGRQAYEEGVSFEFDFSGSVKYLAETEISGGDLAKLISDLLENAIIAERDSRIKNILLYISVCEDKYVLEISDSGIPFEADTVARLGRQRATTHADTGGSGYGMLTVFELLEKCGASFTLEEFEPGGLFTKKIAIRFDGLSQFRLKTERPELAAIGEGRKTIACSNL